MGNSLAGKNPKKYPKKYFKKNINKNKIKENILDIYISLIYRITVSFDQNAFVFVQVSYLNKYINYPACY